jgi:hypothetical protein
LSASFAFADSEFIGATEWLGTSANLLGMATAVILASPPLIATVETSDSSPFVASSAIDSSRLQFIDSSRLSSSFALADSELIEATKWLGGSAPLLGIATDLILASHLLIVTPEVCDSSDIHLSPRLADSLVSVSIGLLLSPFVKRSEGGAATQEAQPTDLQASLSLHYSELALPSIALCVSNVRPASIACDFSRAFGSGHDASYPVGASVVSRGTGFAVDSQEFDESHSFDASHYPKLRDGGFGSGNSGLSESGFAVVWLAVGGVASICLVALLLFLLRLFVTRRRTDSTSEHISEVGAESELNDEVPDVDANGKNAGPFDPESFSGAGSLDRRDFDGEESYRRRDVILIE